MMRAARVSCLLAAALLFSWAAADNVGLTDVDLRAAEQHFMREFPNWFVKSLHGQDRFPDGARGFSIPDPVAQRVEISVVPPFRTKSEWSIFYDYCAWDAIVLAKNLDSTPILNSTKGLIFTVSHFLIVDSIKTDAHFIAGDHIVAYRIGGEVQDEGETLRIATPDMAPFKREKTYLLHLTRAKDASVPQYSLPIAPTIWIADSRVTKIPGGWGDNDRWEEFPSGAAYEDIAATFARVSKVKTCQ
jgi:hypothetical protein